MKNLAGLVARMSLNTNILTSAIFLALAGCSDSSPPPSETNAHSSSVEQELSELVLDKAIFGAQPGEGLVVSFGFSGDNIVSTFISNKSNQYRTVDVLSVDMNYLKGALVKRGNNATVVSVVCKDELLCISARTYDLAKGAEYVVKTSLLSFDITVSDRKSAENIVDMINVVVGGVGEIYPISY